MENNKENDLLNAVIETVVISPTDYGVKFEAQDKKVYNVPKTLKTGGFTKAWEQLVTMNFKPRDPITGESGTVVAIGYVETPNKHGGTSRYIRNFRETNELPTSQPEVPREVKKPDSVANFAPQGESKDDFGRRLTIYGMVNAEIAFKGIRKLSESDIDTVIAFQEILDEKIKNPTLKQPPKVEKVSSDIKELADEMQREADEMQREAESEKETREINGDDIPF